MYIYVYHNIVYMYIILYWKLWLSSYDILSCIKSGCSHRSLRNEMKPRVAHFSLAPLSTMYLEGSYTTVGMVKNGYAVTMVHTWIISGPAFCNFMRARDRHWNIPENQTLKDSAWWSGSWPKRGTAWHLPSAHVAVPWQSTALQLGCSNFRKTEFSGANPDNPTESIALAF